MKKTTLFCLLLLSSILTGCTKQTVNSQYSITDVATLESVVEQIAAEASSYKLVTLITETPFSTEDTKIRHFDQYGNVHIFENDMHYYYVNGVFSQFVNDETTANNTESVPLYIYEGDIGSDMANEMINPDNKEIVKYQFLIYLMDFLPAEVKEEGELSFDKGIWTFTIHDFQVEAEDLQSFTLTIDEETKKMKIILQVTETAKITCIFIPNPKVVSLPKTTAE